MSVVGIEYAIHLGSDFVVNDSPVVIADNVYSEFLLVSLSLINVYACMTHDNILALELPGITLYPFWRKTFRVDKRSVGRS